MQIYVPVIEYKDVALSNAERSTTDHQLLLTDTTLLVVVAYTVHNYSKLTFHDFSLIRITCDYT